MKYQTYIENRIGSWKCCLPFILLLLTMFIFMPVAVAQNDSETQAEPFKINGKDVKEYLIEKYKLRKDDIGDSTNVKQTPNGPKGYLSIMRNIKLKNVILTGRGQDRDRAVAKAFLEEEANLLGITNMDEIHERAIDTSRGHDGDYTTIYYNRLINNLVLNGADIRITIRPDETIAVSAELIPAPPQLYEAVKRKTITKDKVMEIIKQDLLANANKSDSKGMRISEIRKIAISTPPYVVWVANAGLENDLGGWGYTIDAFTEEILKKGYVVIH